MAETTILAPEPKPFLTADARPWHHCTKCDRRWKCLGHTVCNCGWWTEAPEADVETIACSVCTFSLECCECDAGMGIDTKEQAILKGWTGIEADDFGATWTWWGLCPDCRAEQA